MKHAFTILILFALALTAGCRGFSFDASGFESYVDQELDDSADRYSFATLDRVTSCSMEETSEWLSVTNAERAANKALEPTADSMSASELNRYMNRKLGQKSSDWSVSELERVTSKALDVETILRD